MHVTEFIAKVQSVFDQFQSPDMQMQLFAPVDEDLNVVSEKSEDLVTSIRFAFSRSPSGSATHASQPSGSGQ